MNLSYSKLNIYNDCPFKYKWLYIDKNPYKKGIELDKGIFVHSVLEEYVKYLIQHQEIKNLEIFDKIYDEIWHGKEKDEIYDKILPKNDYKKIKNTLMIYVQNDINYENIIGIESWFNFYIPEIAVKFYGKFDRIEKIEKDKDNIGIRLIDYKTGKSDFLDIENDLEIIVYSYALQDLFRMYKFREMQWIYLTSGKIIDIPIPEKEKCKEIIIKKSSKILEDYEFKPQKNKFCNWCDIKKQNKCPLYSGETNEY